MINIGDYAWGNNGSFERILEELMVQVRSSSLSFSLFSFIFCEGRERGLMRSREEQDLLQLQK